MTAPFESDPVENKPAGNAEGTCGGPKCAGCSSPDCSSKPAHLQACHKAGYLGWDAAQMWAISKSVQKKRP